MQHLIISATLLYTSSHVITLECYEVPSWSGVGCRIFFGGGGAEIRRAGLHVGFVGWRGIRMEVHEDKGHEFARTCANGGSNVECDRC